MDRALQIPGNTNAWTMPIKGRIDMLTTGVRTPIGIKVLGGDLNEIQRVGEELEKLMKTRPRHAQRLRRARRRRLFRGFHAAAAKAWPATG